MQLTGLVLSSGMDLRWPDTVLSLLRHLLAPLCHQIPSRSPHFGGFTFPVCFRVGGIYLGALASYVYLAASGGRRRRLPETGDAVVWGVSMLPFFIDGWGNTIHLWSSPDPVRLLTGLGVGVVLPLLLAPLRHQREEDVAHALPFAVPRATAAVWPGLIGVLAGGLLLHPGSMAVFAGLAIAAAAGAVLVVGNLVSAARWSASESSFSVAVRHE